MSDGCQGYVSGLLKRLRRLTQNFNCTFVCKENLHDCPNAQQG